MRLPSSQDYHKYCRKRGTNALCKPCKYYLNQILTYKFALLQAIFITVAIFWHKRAVILPAY